MYDSYLNSLEGNLGTGALRLLKDKSLNQKQKISIKSLININIKDDANDE